MNAKKHLQENVTFIFLSILAIAFLAPIFIVLMNSFKGRFFISDAPFALPSAETFVGIRNYTSGIAKTGFIQAFGYSLFITVFSVATIVLFTSMTAWCITRVKSRISSLLYYLLVFSMIVPFQMVMFTMSKMANIMHLDNPVGIIVIYLGFGAGLSVFIFSGFIKSIPHEIEEAATIDGCNPIQTFF
jgi:raffinose/stachyose/melibiose transport system permease protein